MAPPPPPYPAGRNLLAGKTVVVTAAAGTGIGFSVALRCAEEGARVLISDVHERRLGEAAEKLLEKTGVKPPTVLCNVTSQDDVDRLFARSIEELGHVDVLMNNAGLGGTANVVDMTDAEWGKVMDVSLTGTFRMTRAALAHMIPRKTGAIVNNASVLGWRAQAGQAHYAAAKAGVMALTRCSAIEAAPHGIRINAVAPSLAMHAFLAKVTTKDLLDELTSREAFGRAAEPWEVASVMAFLASDYASYMTGEVLAVSSQHALGARGRSGEAAHGASMESRRVEWPGARALDLARLVHRGPCTCRRGPIVCQDEQDQDGEITVMGGIRNGVSFFLMLGLAACSGGGHATGGSGGSGGFAGSTGGSGGSGSSMGVGGSSGAPGCAGGGGSTQACIPIAPGANDSVESPRAIESSGAGPIEKLVAHGTELTWLANHAVFRATESTWTAPTSFASDAQLTDFAVDGDALYWSVGGAGDPQSAVNTVFRRSLADGPGPGTVAYAGPAATALDGNAARPGFAFVVWGTDPGAGFSMFLHVHSGSGTDETMVFEERGGSLGSPFLLQDGVLFSWANDTGTQGLDRLALGESWPAMLDTTTSGGYVFAGDATGVVFSNHGPLQTFDPITKEKRIISTSAKATGVAVDGGSVFWTDDKGAVSVTPRSGGPRVVLAHEPQGHVSAPVVGAGFVYWFVEGASGKSLHRAARP